MTDFETRLATLLKDATPEPAGGIEASSIIAAQAPRRRAVIIAPIAVAALVVALAVGLAVGRSSHRAGAPALHSPPTKPTSPDPSPLPKSPTDPQALYGVAWVLSTIQIGQGTAEYPDGMSPLRFTPSPSNSNEVGVMAHGCSAAVAIVSPGQLRFTQGFVNGLVAGTACDSYPDVSVKQQRLVDSVLTGTVRFQIANGQLILAGPNDGVLTYRSLGPLPTSPAPSTSGLAEVSGMLEAVGGPAGVPARPLYGTITIVGGTPSADRTIVVDFDGSYRTYLPPGTYTIVGHSPDYNSGASPCQGDPPSVVVHGSTAVIANIYCQER